MYSILFITIYRLNRTKSTFSKKNIEIEKTDIISMTAQLKICKIILIEK